MKATKRSIARNFLSIGMLLGFLTLGAALSAPLAARASDNDHKKPQVKRYYDKKHKDYHEWNDNEDKAYRAYTTENHQEYRPFPTIKGPQQQQYFGWRHDHPDSVLFKVEVR